MTSIPVRLKQRPDETGFIIGITDYDPKLVRVLWDSDDTITYCRLEVLEFRHTEPES